MGFSKEGKWWWKWFYWMDVRMILLNLQMVLLHVNAGPNSLEASVNNWKLCIFQVWCIVKFLCCGWSPSSGISQTWFKSWLAPKKNLLCLSTKNSWAPSCFIGEVLHEVVAWFVGFLRQFGCCICLILLMDTGGNVRSWVLLEYNEIVKKMFANEEEGF